MTTHLQAVQEISGDGLALSVLALTHVARYSRAADGTFTDHREPNGRYCIEATLYGGGVLLEPGAIQYSVGEIQASVQQQIKGNFLTRAIASASIGESAFATRLQGYGRVRTEPGHRHFLLAESRGSAQDAMLLDDRAFYLAQDTMQLGVHTHSSMGGLFGGNGLRQPKLTGRGIFALESPVPADEVEVIELSGGNALSVDGDMMLMYSASLKVELRPMVRGLRSAARSGEGWVYVLTGEGTVYLTPTAVRASVTHAGTSPAENAPRR